MVFALNCNESTGIKCVPYNVFYGRTPVLPMVIDFGTKVPTAREDFIEYLND